MPPTRTPSARPPKKSASAVKVSGGKRKGVGGVRTRRSAQDLRERIVRAATQEFKRCGYAGTTTAAIARKADVTEAQLFRYFGSKSKLFGETVFKPLNQHFQQFIEQHMPDSVAQNERRERSDLYTSELQHFISRHSEMLVSLVVAQTYDAGADHGVGKVESLGTYFDRSAAMMSKRLKGKPKVDPKLMVRMAFASVLGAVMFRDWIFPAGIASDASIEAAINAFVMEGVGANEAR